LNSASDGTVLDPFLQVQAVGSPWLIATATNENVVRFWDIETEKHFVLSLPSEQDKVASIAYNTQKQALTVATKDRKVHTWQYLPHGGGEGFASPTNWQVMHPFSYLLVTSIGFFSSNRIGCESKRCCLGTW
jgi:WD40 repeat protein